MPPDASVPVYNTKTRPMTVIMGRVHCFVNRFLRLGVLLTDIAVQDYGPNDPFEPAQRPELLWKSAPH